VGSLQVQVAYRSKKRLGQMDILMLSACRIKVMTVVVGSSVKTLGSLGVREGGRNYWEE